MLGDNKLFRQWSGRGAYFNSFEELPLGIALEPTNDPTLLLYKGRELANFGTNNYFGTTHMAEVREAAKSAIDKFGVGSTASRLAGGTHQLHLTVEAEISKLFDRTGSVLFNTGYMANFAVLTVLGQSGYRIFIDDECHASVYDGAQRSDAQLVRFRHNDTEHLKEQLVKRGDAGGRNIVCVDGLYSMSGSVAPLAEISRLREVSDFIYLVDEAHSFGTLGPNGLGAADMLGVLDDVDIVTGTFSKAIGSIGGFATFKDATLELLRFAAPSYMYTAALPPPNLAGIGAALDRVIARGADLRARLRANCSQLAGLLNALTSPQLAMPGPVFCLPMLSVPDAIKAWRHVIENGFYLNLVLPPASPRGAPMLRIGVSASHSEGQLKSLKDMLQQLIAQYQLAR